MHTVTDIADSVGFGRKVLHARPAVTVYIQQMDSRPDESGHSRWALPVLLLIAAGIRVVYLLIYSELPLWDQLTIDNYYHYHWAETLANGNILGDTTYFRAPSYVYALGLIYSLFGASLWAARLFGLAVGLASIHCTYHLGRRAFSHQVGLVAAAVQSITPAVLYFEAELLLDMWFTLLLQLSLLAVWRWFDKRRTSGLLVVGLVTGAAAITRPTALVWAGLITVVFLLLAGGAAARLKRVVVYGSGLMLIIGPIFLRNLYVADDPVPIASQGGINLYIGNNEIADGVSARLPEPLGYNWRLKQAATLAEKATGRSLKPGGISDYWTARALEWIAENPGSFVGLYLNKLYFGISDHELSNNRDLKRFYAAMPLLRHNPISFSILLAFAVLGALVGWRHGGACVRLMVGLVVSHLLTMALFFIASRFRLPVLPYLIVLAAVGALTVLDLFATNLKRGVSALLTVVAVWAFSYFPVVALPPGSPSQDLASKGIHYYAVGDIQTSLGYFQAARMVEPSRPETNLNIGACYLRLGFADSALFYLEEERRRHPQRPKTYANLASLFLVSGRFEEATAQAKEALVRAGWDVTANMIYLRALASNDSLSLDSLESRIEQAVKRTDNDLYLLNDASLLLLRRGDTTGAESLLQRALHSKAPPIETDDGAFDRNFPNHYLRRQHERARTHYHLGLLAGLAGKHHLAVSYNRQAIAADSSLAEAYVNLASAYRLTGQTAEADSVLVSVARLFPSNELINKATERSSPQKKGTD